jgi:NTP pyrophosphatase (non-canonical NTP hydrolase)
MSVMKQREYLEQVQGLLNPSIRDGEEYERNIYLVMKLISEAGEIAGEVAKRDFHGKDVTDETLKKEAGDVCWYVYNIIGCLGDNELADWYFEYIDEKIKTTTKESSQFYDLHGMILGLNFECANLSIFDEDHGGFSEYSVKVILDYYIRVIVAMGFDHYEILQMNLDKLNKRHGSTYNAAFYKEKADA